MQPVRRYSESAGVGYRLTPGATRSAIASRLARAETWRELIAASVTSLSQRNANSTGAERRAASERLTEVRVRLKGVSSSYAAMKRASDAQQALGVKSAVDEIELELQAVARCLELRLPV